MARGASDRLRGAAPLAAVAVVMGLAPVLMGSSSAQAAVPRSMAALGDSYTVALFSGAPCSTGAICPANSWSTGTTTSVNSHLRRLRAMSPSTTGFNFALSGRKASDLTRQARLAVGQRVEYVTVMLGLNDACRESEAAMTPVATFRSQIAGGIATLAQGLPNAKILVTSIPDMDRLRTVFASTAAARTAWSQQQVCQVLLANPTSTAPADEARRAAARRRVDDFNTVLQQTCAQHANCRYDGGAVHRWAPSASHFVTRDFFHLSLAGQAALAGVTWAAGFGFSPGEPPPPPPPPPPPTGSAYATTVLGDAPGAYWRLGEASGTVAAAAAGGLAGRYSGSLALGQAGAIAGDASTAVRLSGGYVAVPHGAAVNTADRVTLEAWVKRTTVGTTQGLFSKGTRSYQVLFDAGNRLVLRQAGIGEITRSTVALADKAGWHHVVVTKDGSAVRLFLDGVDRTGPVTNRTLAATTSQMFLGGGAGTLKGTLDEVAVYPRALSAAEVAAHHAAGR